MKHSAAPLLRGVLETVLYYDDEDATHDFYVGVMGMRLLSRQKGRSLFLRAGESVFLMFDPSATRRGVGLPPHGATGSGHVCFVVDPAAYDEWKRHLEDHGVEILQEVEWPGRGDRKGLLSFYLRDPSGNLLEIADGDLWPE